MQRAKLSVRNPRFAPGTRSEFVTGTHSVKTNLCREPSRICTGNPQCQLSSGRLRRGPEPLLSPLLMGVCRGVCRSDQGPHRVVLFPYL